MNDDIFANLNPQQAEAVRATEGPLLILAGAGSGKTRVLTYRIAYLIREKDVNPWNIMAITFTNKAAGEMRDRVDRLVGMGSESIWVSTFHSSCCRILRRFIDRIGYDRSFTIYDTDDSRQVMKEVIRELELDTRVYKERKLLAEISAAKNELITPDEYERQAGSREERRMADIYRVYQNRLRKNNALDFDDLLFRTVELFEQVPDVLDYYQERFRYIMVDEYQDTNTAQFRFVSLLAQKYRNLCVVGDDDQSIYRFRGANIQNILNFERVFSGAKVIRLEQNYRSTQSILDAANEVIAHNVNRKEKKLWTDNGQGDRIRFRQFMTGFDEAEFVAGEIVEKVRRGEKQYSDFAVLYRTNAQSRLFEEKFITANVPYKLVGGVNFYARREIKDLLAYLKTVDNGKDDLACERIINIPKRGIGQATIGKVERFAEENEMSFYDALLVADSIPGLGRAASRIRGFTTMIERYRAVSHEYLSVKELLEQIIADTGYRVSLEAEGTDEARARIENIDELLSKTADYEAGTEHPSLSEFLQQVSLVADIDSVEEGSDYVILMTLHSAKGLEFDSVYMVGMEDGLFPGFLSVNSGDQEELEEERRLCYVGITRAKRHLTLTAARERMVRGETQFMKASRFVREIPRDMIELDRDTTDTRNFMKPAASVDEILGMGRSKNVPKPAPFKMREFKVTKADHLDYGVGDRVRHQRFGVGTVQDIKDGPKDYEVTVNFDSHGIKRMFASFAKLQKLDD